MCGFFPFSLLRWEETRGRLLPFDTDTFEALFDPGCGDLVVGVLGVVAPLPSSVFTGFRLANLVSVDDWRVCCWRLSGRIGESVPS